MPRLYATPARPRLVAALALVAGLAAARPAAAQFGPGFQPGRGAPPPPASDQKEGPAEAAPKDKGQATAFQPLGDWPEQRERRLFFFQLNGYARFRAYLFNNFNLGYFPPADQTNPAVPGLSFPVPFSEYGDGSNAASCASRQGEQCRADNLTSADMRLRLEPTIHVTEQVRVKAQIDVFDNLVLGTTPEGYYLNNSPTSAATVRDVPFVFGSRTQQAPEPGLNAVYDSIRAKRAWAEVRLPFGELRFGRMPNHFGMGIVTNSGDCLDCDYGQNADRVMFTTRLWGHFFSALWDWVATGPTTQIIGPQAGQGVFYNAEPLDDAGQWVLTLGRADSPEAIRERLAKGKISINYGGWFAYRHQTWANTPSPRTFTNNEPVELQQALVVRGAHLFLPDLWLRIDWRRLHVFLQVAGVFGTLAPLVDLYPAAKQSLTVASGGFALRAHYALLRDALKVHLDAGFASGDDGEDPRGLYNVRLADRPPVGNVLSRFSFDPDFIVDLILFRRIIGAVSNAAYVKPGISYDLFDRLLARLDVMYAVAHRPVAYPGNSPHLGVEMDLQLLYRDVKHGFYASLMYGVLFPLDGLDFRGDIYSPANDASIAQTLQARLWVKF
jgi:uncharacterized protein (TIGR04551 family)